MSAMNAVNQLRERVSVFWIARTEQERLFLSLGGAVLLAALVYLMLIAPAVSGRAALQKELPVMRQKAAELQAMATVAAQLASAPVTQLPAPTRESLNASLGARSLAPSTLVPTGEYFKLEFKDASFANLVSWLDTQRRESRLTVQDANFVALATDGQVNASITLRQNSGAPK